MATTTSLELEDELDDRIRRIADKRQRTSSWVMREAIRRYVEQEENRETIRRDALVAWEEYEATGLHLTAGEVEGWLSSWGEEGELPTPECHA